MADSTIEQVEDAIKRGMRNSSRDQERLQGIHDYAVENGAMCGGQGKSLDDAAPDETLISQGDAVKALGDGRVGGYLVRFSTESDPDLTGDYFTPDTDFGPHTTLPLYYQHGTDPVFKRARIGDGKVTRDDAGLWFEAQIRLADDYERKLYALAERGKLGLSSGALGHLVEREPVGKAYHLKTWIIGEASLTPTPAEPRNRVIPLKSLSEFMPPVPPFDAPEGDNAPEQTSDGGTNTKSLEVTKMDITEERLQEIVTQAANASVEKALKSLPAEPVKSGVTVVKDAADQPFETTGQYFKAVKNAALGNEDIRLRGLKANALGMNESIPSEGGYLVPPQIAPGIIERMYPAGSLLAMVASDPVSGNSMTYNRVDETSRANGSRYGGLQSYWGAEAASPTATQPKWAQMELKLKKVFALAYATDELLEDGPALESWLMRTVPNEIRFKVEDAIVNGTGMGTPLGFLAHTDGLVSIAKESSQAADTIVYENIIKMWARRWIGANDYVWLINQDCLPQLMTIAHAVGTAAIPPNFITFTADGVGRIMGRPIMELEYMPTVGDAGDITLFSPSQYQMIRKNGIQAATSIHVQFLTGQTAYRWTFRIDGQPTWVSAVTPYKGTANTIAPVVITAERA